MVKSLAHTPAIYAVLVGLAIYLLQIPIPALLAQPISLLGAMNTPLSMLITGMLIGILSDRILSAVKRDGRKSSSR